MGGVPKPPAWARWMIRWMLSDDEARVVMDELRELHAHWTERDGRPTADERYRRQLRQYPLRLLVQRLGSVGAALRSLTSVRNMTHAARALVRVPALSTAIVLTIGVGIGGCTAIFAVVDALYITPLPYPDADRLAWIYTDAPPNRWPLSVADYQALVEQQTSFDAVAAYRRGTATFTARDVADRVSFASVTPGFFRLMGIDLIAGREAVVGEGVPGADRTLVVTAGFAGRYLSTTGPTAGAALGQMVTLDGSEYNVVGVLADEHGPLGRDIDVFSTFQLEAPPRKGPFFLSVFGRLRVDAGVAAEELRSINDRLFPIWADSYQDEEASWGLTSVQNRLLGETDRLLLALMGSVGLLLLMATANAANLLLARVGSRRRELAVRIAVGASRARVVGYLLAESAILAFGGMVVGLALAWGAIEVMPTMASGYVPRLQEVALDGTVLGFAMTLAVGSGVLFGLISSLTGSTGDLGVALRAGGRSVSAGVRQQRAQQALVVGQLAIAVPLLAGAGLLSSSFARLSAVDPGFDTERLVSVPVPLARGRYADRAARDAFWEEAAARLTALPGVSSIGVASASPPTQVGMINNFDLEDRPTPPGASEPSVPWVYADNGYFEALGISLLSGRWFDPLDEEAAAPVVLVDEAWATRFFPGEEVLGRRMVSGGCTSCPLTTVVGVVGTVPYLGLQRADEGAIYSPGARGVLSNPVLHLKTTGEASDVIPSIRAELRELDSSIPLTQFSLADELMSDSLAQPRQLSVLLAAFSLIALVLAIVGLYGIMAYSVQQRRGDIAIRLALGGSPADVLVMVLSQGIRLAGIGLVLGLLAAVTFTRLLSDLLFEVEANDPMTLLAVTVVLLAVSLVACGLPGRRAVRVDPVGALRAQ